MPSPPDEATATRLRVAHAHAAAHMDVTVVGAEETWGWEGRSLSRPVADSRWLRLRAAPPGKAQGDSWDGSEAAEKTVPDEVPRPRLHGAHQWLQDGYTYRAELYDRVLHPTLSQSALLASALDLPQSWWDALGRALDSIASTKTGRIALREDRMAWRIEKFIGPQIETDDVEWRTAHADIQWSNLTGPDLRILDWERWGLAPVAYDAATLYVSSLTVPEAAARVRQELGHVLETPAGAFSELVVASEFLQGMERGNNLELETPLRRRVTELLG